MPTVTAGNSERVTLPAGDAMVISTTGEAVFSPVSGLPGSRYSNTQVRQTTVFGPYSDEAVVDVVAKEGDATYTIQVLYPFAGAVISSSDPLDDDGRPDGTLWIKVTP